MTALEKLLAGVRLADDTIKEILAPVEMTRDNELRELEEALVFAAPTLARIVERMLDDPCGCEYCPACKQRVRAVADCEKIAAGVEL